MFSAEALGNYDEIIFIKYCFNVVIGGNVPFNLNIFLYRNYTQKIFRVVCNIPVVRLFKKLLKER